VGISSNRYLRYKYLGVHTPPAGDAQLPAQVVARGGPPAATLAPADGDPPAAAAAFRLLDAALSRGGGGGGVGGGDLVGRLRDAGALRGGGAANLVAQYSTRRARVTRGGAAARPAACPRAGRCAAPPRSDLLRLKAKPVQRLPHGCHIVETLIIGTRASRGRLADTLPKHWGGGGGGGAAGGAGDVAAALADKLGRHGALLRALGADGLAALDPVATR